MSDNTKNDKPIAMEIRVTAEEMRERLMSSILEHRTTYYNEDGDEVGRGPSIEWVVADAVKKDVLERFGESIQKAVDAACEQAVKAQLEEGLFTTDNYGSASKRKTINQLIQETLNAKVNRYNEPPATFVENAVAKAVNAAFEGEMRKVLDEVKGAFAAQVKAKLAAGAGEAISRALGIF